MTYNAIPICCKFIANRNRHIFLQILKKNTNFAYKKVFYEEIAGGG